MDYYKILFILVIWMWAFEALFVKEKQLLLLNGKVVITKHNKIWAWALLVTAIFQTASFIYLSVVTI